MDKYMSRIRDLSKTVTKRIKKSDMIHLSEIDAEDLLDVQKILQLIDHLFTKHEHKKQIRDLLSEFVNSAHTSVDIMRRMDMEIDELKLAIEDSLVEITEIRARLESSNKVVRKY
ncbi:MAG: hypothetical protein K8823_661 [Cenarchaeum symbiont of Oopsacas minuta]|nr:hypothetical protein [Cenarchaeum symbiont of Oopsacas minuta]